MITLINPPFSQHSTEYFNYHRGKYPHLSLACIAGYLEKRGIRVSIIDAKFNDLDFENIVKLIKKYDSKIIGFTSTTTEINNTQLLIKYIKNRMRDAFLILGGVHACALPEQTIEANPYLDAVAFTEGEQILHELAISKNLDAALPDIDGIIYRRNGKIIKNKPRLLPSTLNDYGPMALQHWPGAKRFHVQTYRGCPFACSFCFRATGRKPRLRSIADIMADLEYITNVSIDGYLNICDATFGLNRQHTERVLQEIIKKGFNKRLHWTAGTRVDIGDYNLLKLMQEAGCYNVAFGIESGSERILGLTGKNTSTKQALQIVKDAKKLGLETSGYYILGHIGETKAEVKQTVKLIWKLNTDYISIGVMVPWPGTRVYQLAKQNQGGYKLLTEDYDKFDKYFGEVMQFKNFSSRYLDIMRIIAYIKLYLFNFRVKDLMHFLIKNNKRALIKLKQLASTNLQVVGKWRLLQNDT